MFDQRPLFVVLFCLGLDFVSFLFELVRIGARVALVLKLLLSMSEIMVVSRREKKPIAHNTLWTSWHV